MNDRILVILSTAEAGKARTGAMYAVNALRHGWVEDVKLVLFGPAEELVLTDEPLQALLDDFRAMEETPVACKFIADRDGLADRLGAMKIDVQYVGKLISDLIREGYVPLVW